MKIKNIISLRKKITLVFLALLFSTIVSPVYAETSTQTYQPRTQLEYIAYLQGVVAALEAQIRAQQSVGSGSYSTRAHTLDADVEVRAEAVLSSRFEMGNYAYVNAWFEYGEDDDLDKTTAKVKINRSQSTVEHKRRLTDLDFNSDYSYRAVFETPSGERFHGKVKTFDTDNLSRSYRYDDDDDDYFDYDVNLSVDDDYYRIYDTIEVSWDGLEFSNRNSNYYWIGMYRVGADDDDYISWQSVYNEDGEVQFYSYYSGRYEFRMFANNSYDLIAESDVIVVERE